MASEAPGVRASAPSATWLAAALAAGGVAGLAGTAGSSAPLVAAGVLAALMAVALAVFVLAEPERGLWLMLLAIPLDTAGRLITSPVTLTVFHVTLLLTLAAWALRWLADPDDARPRWSVLDIGIATLVAAAVWSLPGSLAPLASVVSLVRLVFMWLFFLLFVNWVRNERSVRRVILLVVLTSVLSSLVALVQYLVPEAGIGYTHTQIGLDDLTLRPAAFFDDPNYLATMLSVGIIAATGMAIAARRLTHALAWLAAVLVSGAGLLVTLSRTGWFGVLAGLAVLVLSAPKAIRRWLITAALLVIPLAMLIAPGAVVSRVVSVGDIDRDASIRTRYLMFESSVDIISDHWVFGTGLSAYESAYPPYRRLGARIDILRPHQLPLAMWAEMGLLGLFAGLLIIGGVVWVVRHRRFGAWSVYESIGIAGLVAIFVQSLFQYYLYFAYLWLFLALIVVASRLSVRTEEGST